MGDLAVGVWARGDGRVLPAEKPEQVTTTAQQDCSGFSIARKSTLSLLPREITDLNYTQITLWRIGSRGKPPLPLAVYEQV